MAGHSNSVKILDELASGKSAEIRDNPKQLEAVPTDGTDHLVSIC